MTQILNEQDFEQYVYDAHGKVLVEFFATWCPHCQKMQPLVDQLAEDAAGAQVYQVDVDQSPDLAAQYAPDGFPCFVLFDNGEKTAQLLGEQSREALAELIER